MLQANPATGKRCCPPADFRGAEDSIPGPFHWFPIRSLGPRQRPRILSHLLSLGEHDRYLRFGYIANDAHIGRYVDQLDFERDEVFGIFNRRLELVAMAHLAYLGHDGQRPPAPSSASRCCRAAAGAASAARLFESACLHARNRGIDTMIVHALTENMAMLKIARSAGATLEREGPTPRPSLQLPPEDLGSHLTQMVEVRPASWTTASS
jgi:hypothetical protein